MPSPPPFLTGFWRFLSTMVAHFVENRKLNTRQVKELRKAVDGSNSRSLGAGTASLFCHASPSYCRGSRAFARASWQASALAVVVWLVIKGLGITWTLGGGAGFGCWSSFVWRGHVPSQSGQPVQPHFSVPGMLDAPGSARDWGMAQLVVLDADFGKCLGAVGVGVGWVFWC